MLPPTNHDVCHMWNSLCGESPCRFRSTYLVCSVVSSLTKITLVFISATGTKTTLALVKSPNKLLAHLALMLISLCNHELSVVWCCWHCHHCWHHCHWHCLWTVLPATGLITETSYLAHTCTYGPSICTWIS